MYLEALKGMTVRASSFERTSCVLASEVAGTGAGRGGQEPAVNPPSTTRPCPVT